MQLLNIAVLLIWKQIQSFYSNIFLLLKHLKARNHSRRKRAIHLHTVRASVATTRCCYWGYHTWPFRGTYPIPWCIWCNLLPPARPGQTNTYENITFPQLYLRAVKKRIISWIVVWPGFDMYVLSSSSRLVALGVTSSDVTKANKTHTTCKRKKLQLYVRSELIFNVLRIQIVWALGTLVWFGFSL